MLSLLIRLEQANILNFMMNDTESLLSNLLVCICFTVSVADTFLLYCK